MSNMPGPKNLDLTVRTWPKEFQDIINFLVYEVIK
jgi:hypothetical protein